jgi:hypothetical protein
MEHEHSVEEIKKRLAAGLAHNYLRDWIYGGVDGAVTTFAVVSGVAGRSATFSDLAVPGVILMILGCVLVSATGPSVLNLVGIR